LKPMVGLRRSRIEALQFCFRFPDERHYQLPIANFESRVELNKSAIGNWQ